MWGEEGAASSRRRNHETSSSSWQVVSLSQKASSGSGPDVSGASSGKHSAWTRRTCGEGEGGDEEDEIPSDVRLARRAWEGKTSAHLVDVRSDARGVQAPNLEHPRAARRAPRGLP